MPPTATLFASHANILLRALDPGQASMPAALAASILTLNFPPDDDARIAVLSEKANEGLLSEAEAAELEAYLSVSSVLALWQSRARQTLRAMGDTGPERKPVQVVAAIYSEVFGRLLNPRSEACSPALAEGLLKLRLSPVESKRVAVLNEKANEGLLTPSEDAELEAYIDIVDMISLWQSRAKRS